MESKCNSNPSTPGRMSSDQRRDQDEEVKKGAKKKKKGRGKRKRPDILIPRPVLHQPKLFLFSLFVFFFHFPNSYFFSRDTNPSTIDSTVCAPSHHFCLSFFLFFSFLFIFYFLFFIFYFLSFASFSNGRHPLASSSKLS